MNCSRDTFGSFCLGSCKRWYSSQKIASCGTYRGPWKELPIVDMSSDWILSLHVESCLRCSGCCRTYRLLAAGGCFTALWSDCGPAVVKLLHPLNQIVWVKFLQRSLWRYCSRFHYCSCGGCSVFALFAAAAPLALSSIRYQHKMQRLRETRSGNAHTHRHTETTRKLYCMIFYIHIDCVHIHP